MNRRFLKSVGRCARRGKACLQPAVSCVQLRSAVTPNRFYHSGLPLVLLGTALVLSVIQGQKTEINIEQQLDEIPAVAVRAAPDNAPPTIPAPPSALRHSLPGEQIFHSLSVQSSQELIDQLKEFKLWNDIREDVPPVIFNSFPADLGKIDVNIKKKTFVHALLPAIMIVRDEVQKERLKLLQIIDELGGPIGLDFAATFPNWQETLSQEQIAFINGLGKKYRSRKATELLARVNVLPTSLILAQAAIESSWGSSRFSWQANNLFGMWTWGEKGIIPARREAGKRHKIAIYDSILDSVRSYLLTINRLEPYSDLRQIRNSTMNANAIAEGLLNYSQRKQHYVASIKQLMSHNNFDYYDKCRLADAG